MTDKTVAQHLADSKALAQTIADANALVLKLQDELQRVRSALETLEQWSHPRMEIGPIYGSDYKDHKSMTGAQICQIRIKRINAILGDRA